MIEVQERMGMIEVMTQQTRVVLDECSAWLLIEKIKKAISELTNKPNASLEQAERSDGTLQDFVGNSAEDLARAKWNAEADEYNQWDSLGQDEKDVLIANDTLEPQGKAGLK